MGANWESAESEYNERRRLIIRFFSFFRDKDAELANAYVEFLQRVPLKILAAALESVVQSHIWKSLPTVGEIYQAAKVVAGMHREQYLHGRYLAPHREWPPDGYCYGILAGELEPVDADGTRLLSAGMSPQQLTGGEDYDA